MGFNMKKCMILLAGYPATGKSSMCALILKKYPRFQTVNQDEMKEQMWDEYGFNNQEEKTKVENMAWARYYAVIEEKMKQGECIISDYPFSDKQKGRLTDLSRKYGYEVITIRSLGNIEHLYEVSRKRDLAQDRHLGHLVSCYHKGDVLEDRTQADSLVTYEIFQDRCLHKGYDKFQMGHLIEVDASDFSKIDYAQILEEIGKLCSE
ncbi:AAA domain-containing protein [Faecalicatena orotica]|uniref:AAA domain-containing protein n=2 Tax=Bacillota TaxID=1239 RepID=A0A2Y9BG99_9FIRM|nr:AAA domain-containing protein [Faecalicatena orotica]SSA55309.1 AAA domain-containing protein [Faecalicatena orotica]